MPGKNIVKKELLIFHETWHMEDGIVCGILQIPQHSDSITQ